MVAVYFMDNPWSLSSGQWSDGDGMLIPFGLNTAVVSFVASLHSIASFGSRLILICGSK